MKRFLTTVFFISIFLASCQDPNALPSGKLTGSQWASNAQLSELYASHNVQVTLNFRFIGKSGHGIVEVWEGDIGSSSKSCTTEGEYKLSDDRKSLELSGIYNSNCPHLEALNGTYLFSREGNTLVFRKGSISIVT